MSPVETGSLMTAAPTTRRTGWYLPWVVLGVVAVYLLSVFGRMNPPKEPYNLNDFARLPVVEGGRVKPLESAARVYLRMISGREEFADEKGDKQPAIRWYLDVLAGGGGGEKGGPAWKYKAIRIDNEQLLSELNLKPVEGLRYSLDDLGPKWEVIAAKSAAADDKRRKGKPIDLTETKILELANRLQLIINIGRFKGLDARDNKLLLLPPATAGDEWQSLGEYREAAFHDGKLAAMRTARDKVGNRLDALTPAEVAKLVEKLHGVQMERLKPQQQEQVVKASLQFLKADPATLPEEARTEWLEATLELLPADQEAIRATLKTDTDARLNANAAAVAWDKMVTAYREKRPDGFNQALADYQATQLQNVAPKDLAKVRIEAMYNRFAPFYQCTGLYVLVFLVSIAGFVASGAEKRDWGIALRLSATRLLLLTLAVHTAALLMRMYVMDRPFVFVTNLYSSAIFIGWGCVALGAILERLYPIGIGNVLAATLGLATTIVAHNLATEDTLEMMQAVLDTNFWLSTHVTTVTLGYTATFVAGFLGIAYVVQMLAAVIKDSYRSTQPTTNGALLAFGVAAAGIALIPALAGWVGFDILEKLELIHPNIATLLKYGLATALAVYALCLLITRAGADAPNASPTVPAFARPVVGLALTPEVGKVLGQMTYGVLCFATLLSFVGTVLGGIWADQSWGRFWGWDPKENGAVLIVLWNSLILHARWCGLVKDRGVAVLAVGGNMICAWSWFGTNQLGIGLHAYGFDTRLADGCANFWFSQLVIIGLGLIPRPFWSSATRRLAAAPMSISEPAPAAPAPRPPESNGHHKPGGKKSRRR